MFSSPGSSSSHDGVCTKQSAPRTRSSRIGSVCGDVEPLPSRRMIILPVSLSLAFWEDQICERSDAVCTKSSASRRCSRGYCSASILRAFASRRWVFSPDLSFAHVFDKETDSTERKCLDLLTISISDMCLLFFWFRYVERLSLYSSSVCITKMGVFSRPLVRPCIRQGDWLHREMIS